MSRFNKFIEWILRLPILWGGVAGLAFYASLDQGWINSPLLKQYMAGHRVEYIIGMMFFIGLAALAIRFLEVTGQYASIDNVRLGPISLGGVPVSACDQLTDELDALARTIVRFFAEGLRERMAAPIAALKAEHSWEALADSTMSLIDELKPARGWA